MSGSPSMVQGYFGKSTNWLKCQWVMEGVTLPKGYQMDHTGNQNTVSNFSFLEIGNSDDQFRIHTFGGREIGVDDRGVDLGWTQDSQILAKYPRNFGLSLAQNGSVYLTQDGQVNRLQCEIPLSKEQCYLTLAKN